MKVLLALFFATVSLTSIADQLQGKVIKVTDGDTINVLTNDNQTHKIRLSGIDAPENNQAFGSRSKQALAEAVYGKTVVVDYNKRDKYQRLVGKVLLNGKDMNLRQVQLGMAWHYKKYEHEQDVEDRSVYANAEYQAQREKLGLWIDANSIPPWEFRKLRRKATK